VVAAIPIKRLLIETDCPYLAPQNFRGKRNEPAYVIHVAEKISEIKNLPVKDTIRVTRYNAIRLFSLPLETPPEIAYELYGNLYLNTTNACSNACDFCHRQRHWFVKGHNLKLNTVPSLDDIMKEIPQDLSGYGEVVFCGLGEPTERMDIIRSVIPLLRKRKAKCVRLDTNGQGNLINGRNIVPEIAALFDSVSISLNASSREEYNQICSPDDLENAWNAVVEFIHSVSKVLPETRLSAVDHPSIDKAKLKEFAQAEFKKPVRLRKLVPLDL
jgi:TatD DNase family protein